MNGGVILLVEDNEDFADLAVRVLEREEFTNEVVVARDGVEATDYLFELGRQAWQMPCLVLLDLHMPRMDGLGVLTKMRSEERTRHVPVVMLTSSAHPDDVRAAYEAGANSYLDKISGALPWPEMIRTVARYWLGMNLSPHS
jgi:CheY-like chemotaxis protein